MPLTVATWNVNGIRARAQEVCDWIAGLRPDAFFIQVRNARPDQVPERVCNDLAD